MIAPLRWPGWWLTLFACTGVAVTLLAANWQFSRAELKARLKSEYAQRQARPVLRLGDGPAAIEDVRYRRVEATGEFVPAGSIYIDNRIRKGMAGYEIVTPLRLSGSGTYLLINRGWVARGPERAVLPRLDIPAGLVTIVGTAVVPSESVYELSEATTEGPIWQNLVLSRYRAHKHIDILDFVLQQEGGVADGLVREWDPPGFGIDKHRSYAVQWMLFAMLIVIFYVYYGFFRSKPASPQ